MRIEDKMQVFKICNGRNDMKIAEKLLEGIEHGLARKDNYWDFVKSYTDNLKSDRWLERWQIISEYIYNNYFN